MQANEVSSQEVYTILGMKWRYWIWGVASGILILAVLLAFLMARPTSRQQFATKVTVEQPGRFGNSIYSRAFHVHWFTNTSRRDLLLWAEKSQWRQGERVVTDMDARWNGLGRELKLPAGSVAGLAVNPQEGFEATRVWFACSWDGGRVLAGVSKVVQRLPLRLLPDNAVDWMRKRGLLDGEISQQCVSAWEPNQSAAPEQPPPAALPESSETSNPEPEGGVPRTGALSNANRKRRSHHDE